MKNVLITPATYGTHGITRRAGMLTLLGGALALAGCGGGGDGLAAVGTGGTGSFSVGPITGFGSVIVNGVRYDDSGPNVIRDGDDGPHGSEDLKLGMMVTVAGSTVENGRSIATSIVFGGELRGRIEGIPDSVQKTFVVLGQTVKVMTSTMFDPELTNGFNSLANDTVVEVHGFLNPVTNTLTATFIEKKTDPALFKIEGLVTQYNGDAKTFSIGTMNINYSATDADNVRIEPIIGALVRVRVNAVLLPTAVGVWTATRIRSPEGANNEAKDAAEAEIKGSITAFTSAAQFSVNGIPVTTSSTTRLDLGTASLAIGVRVEVKGRLSGGVLIAERVKIEDDNDIDNLEFELHGTASNVTSTTFTLTSSGGMAVNVTYTSALIIGLANNSKIEVKGIASPDGTKVIATRIEFES